MAYRWLAKIALFLSIGLVGCAGSSKYMVKAEAPTAAPPPDQALVYVMRPSAELFNTNFQIWDRTDFQIWDRDRFIGLSQAKSYFAYLCPPGKHLFIGIAENNVAVEADLAPGLSYYIITRPGEGRWRARLAMEPVTQGSETWATVETLKGELEFIVPVADRVQAWEARGKARVAALVNFFERNPERAKYMRRLAPGDGR